MQYRIVFAVGRRAGASCVITLCSTVKQAGGGSTGLKMRERGTFYTTNIKDYFCLKFSILILFLMRAVL